MNLNKIAFIGIGNTILGDDAVGIIIANKIASKISATVFEETSADLSSVEIFDDFNKVIIIDSMITGKHPIGTLVQLDIGSFMEKNAPFSAHGRGIGDLLELAQGLGIEVDKKIKIYGFEIETPQDFTEELSPALMKPIELAVEKIIGQIEE